MTPFVRRSLWTFLTVVALIALLIILVDWNGAREWRATQAMLAKEGQTLDFRAICPDPIPDGDNFCAVPILKDVALVIDEDDDRGEPATQGGSLTIASKLLYGYKAARPMIGGAALGERTDLKQWSAWLRKEASLHALAGSEDAAHDVLASLAGDDGVFKELATGLVRRRAQWTPAWKTRVLPRNPFIIQLPHLLAVMGLYRSVALRSIAAARAGEIAEAYQSAQIMTRLDEASMEEPFLLGVSEAAYETTLLADVTWELCDAQRGAAEDFRQLESALAGIDFHRATLRAFRGELIYGVDGLQFAKENPGECRAIFQPIYNMGKPLPRAVLIPARAVPSGILDANAAVLADCEFVYLIMPLRDGGWRAALASGREFQIERQRWLREIAAHPFGIVTHSSYLVAAMFAPDAEREVSRAIYAQALVHQAIIACALERYRIENGGYPDSLGEAKLADGRPLPVDTMTGEAMSYSRTANGKYALWSVALSGKKHGGKRVLDGKRPEDTRFRDEDYAGDWVWDFPEKSGNILSQSEVPRARIVR